jgi:hypothetical protein
MIEVIDASTYDNRKVEPRRLMNDGVTLERKGLNRRI